VLEAAAPPPSAILDLLLLHKPDIVMLLRPGRDGQSAADWHAFCHERARFAALDAGLRPRSLDDPRIACRGRAVPFGPRLRT
jgi:hypothetical protein